MANWIVLLLVLLPAFFLGIAGGLWARRIFVVLPIGLAMGLLAAVPVVLVFGPHPIRVNREMVFSFSLYLILPAVVGSFVGYRIRPQRPRPIGHSLLFSVLAALCIAFWPGMESRHELVRRPNCLSNLKQIGLALAMYADEYRGQLPPENGAKGLDYLLRTGILDKTNGLNIFHCQKDSGRLVARAGKPPTEDTVSYVYKPGPWQPAIYTNDVPICWDKPENHGTQGLNVLFNDGHVQWVTLRQWNKIKPDK